MKVLVIGKPTYNFILPLDKFISEGAKINISERQEVAGGASVYAASLLGKWKVDVYYTGLVSNDPFGAKIKSQLDNFNVNTKFIEINYENPNCTSTNYIIINKSNGSSTEILRSDSEINLTKYKYDFIPDYIIMDGTDPAGSFAALNNFPHATSILFANKVSEKLYDISKKCNYVVANTSYAKALTKLELEIKRPKALVNFMQKIKDLNKAQYVIMMKENGVLYTSNNQVKMIPAIQIEKKEDDTHSGYMFFAAFTYGIINNYGMDNSVKIANIAAGLSLTKVGSINAMLELADVLKLAGLKEVTEPVNTEVLE
ncbi:MAG: PfkB family carbohydrate kinase [Bacilli bacterium]|nr:PfkB family carbohydrate kinase [Bacilli bacterium]MDD4406662.1 PfkB family carbohydrate kinase [Bacilli bacterium]